jgi:molybdopterin/thiamine biosynthesis adenylyltransferase/redox-sensitive bicupin YhaK (pirin superfamily)
MTNPLFSSDEWLRYSRQINLKTIGLSGQEKLKNAKVLCIGLGGLGSSLLLYLAAAGVGRLGLVDADRVELSNLQRQVLYRLSQVSLSKTACASEQILALNPLIQVDTYNERLTETNAVELISQYDIVADCSDNFQTNYLIHDVCFMQRKPYVYASVSQFQGYCSLFIRGNEGPCLRCVFPATRDSKFIPTCDAGGIVGVVPGLLGTIQATEIIKWIVGIGQVLEKRLLMIDLLKMTFKEIQLFQAPDCPLCDAGTVRDGYQQKFLTLNQGEKMINVYPYGSLGTANYGWLNTHYHFSFADYHNPRRMGFGNLRVINDDIIQPGTGFSMHPHRDMEIITYVTQGAITHKDSEGNQGRTEAGNVQVMTAGKGIRHSEYNLEPIETKLFQIWIKPQAKNLKPSWKTHQFPEYQSNKLFLLVSGDGSAPLTIHQDARIYAGNIVQNQSISHNVQGNAYLVVVKGQLSVNGVMLNEGDGAEITENSTIALQSFTDSKLLLIEV